MLPLDVYFRQTGISYFHQNPYSLAQILNYLTFSIYRDSESQGNTDGTEKHPLAPTHEPPTSARPSENKQSDTLSSPLLLLSFFSIPKGVTCVVIQGSSPSAPSHCLLHSVTKITRERQAGRSNRFSDALPTSCSLL